MRIAIAISAVATLSFGIVGCLPSYDGPTGTPPAPDMAYVHINTPPEGPPDPIPPPADLAGAVQVDAFVSSGTAMITLSENTSALRLNEKKDITVTIDGKGATGSATLSLASAPAGFTATFNPATVTLGSSPVTATMTVQAASNMDPATSVAATVQMDVGAMSSSTTYGITVMPELLVMIPSGVVTTSSNPTAFGAATIPVKLVGTGTKITFVNQDGIEHRIHADGTGGLAHEPVNMAANGGSYTGQMLVTKGPINFSCHIHGNMKGVLDVQ